MNIKKKVLTLIGARPQFIKAAPLSKAFSQSSKLEEIIIHTGQHYDTEMSDIFFKDLGLPIPKMNINAGSGSHAVQTAKIMERLEPILIKEKPDLVVIFGDTNSTLAGALTAAKLNIPIAHVEAGLRSFNRSMPEEINRIVADRLSALLFCPTGTSVQNLKNEGITTNVFKTGDVMYDVALYFSDKALRVSNILSDLGLQEKNYILVTVHRAENTDHCERLANILLALGELARHTTIVFPLHPRTSKRIEELGLVNLLKGIKVIKPVGFLDMIFLESKAKIIITDSGGVQKEAYFHKVPCVTLRDETEWIETIKAGWNTLADTLSVEAILAVVEQSHQGKTISEYGEGSASQLICRYIEEYLNQSMDKLFL